VVGLALLILAAGYMLSRHLLALRES